MKVCAFIMASMDIFVLVQFLIGFSSVNFDQVITALQNN